MVDVLDSLAAAVTVEDLPNKMSDTTVNILLVEDDAAHVKLVKRSIAHMAELELATVGSLSEARQLLAQSSPDLMLIDLLLPDGSGMDLLGQSVDRGCLPVVVLTSQGDEQLAVEAMKRGALDYVVKSEITLNGMPQIVRRALREWDHLVRRRESEQALSESEQRYRSLFEQAPDLICFLDPSSGRIMDCNTNAAEILGYTRAELCQLCIADIEVAISPKDTVRRFANLVRDGRDAFETRIRTKGGKFRDVAVSVSPITVADQTYSQVIAKDITERNQLEQRLQRAERLASLGSLAAGIAHEINNPMSAAWMAAETAKAIKDMAGTGDMLNECLSTISDAVRRSRDIIENVQRLARQEASEKQLYDVNEIVRLAASATDYYTKTYGVTIILNLAEDLPTTKVDPSEIEQVLVNLIHNAVQSGGAMLISVSTKACDDAVRLQVRDDGCGMPVQDVERIFDPFFTKNTRGGTGLGLAISHRIIEDHGGHIEVESQVGEGSAFTVVFPITVSPSSEKPLHFGHSGIRKDAAP